MFGRIVICGRCNNGIDISTVLGDSYNAQLSDLEVLVPSTAPVASNKQRRAVQNLLPRLEESSRTIDLAIEGLEARLESLRETRQRLTDVYERQCSIVAPIRCLPPEILPLVFRESSPVTLLKPRDIYEVWRERTTLMLVCRHWNLVALSAPQLWNVACFFAGFQRNRKRHALLPRLLHMWLKRAGSAPLDVILCPSFYASCGNATLCDILLPFHRQWKTVTITPYLPRPKQSLQKVFEGTLPFLEKLVLAPGPSRRDRRYHLLPLLFTSPHLKSLELHEIVYSDFPLPANQLTHIHFYSVKVSWTDMRNLFKSSGCLETLEISSGLHITDRTTTSDEEGIILPHLKTWTTRDDIFTGNLLWQIVTAPALLHFTVISTIVFNGVLPDILGLFQRSGCPLASLCLRTQTNFAPAFEDDVLDIIHVVPTITSLTVDVPFKQELWSAFCGSAEGGDPSASQLKVLRTWVENEGQLKNFLGLLKVLQSRKKGGGMRKVKNLDIIFRDQNDAGKLPPTFAAVLRKKGISVQYGDSLEG